MNNVFCSSAPSLTSVRSALSLGHKRPSIMHGLDPRSMEIQLSQRFAADEKHIMSAGVGRQSSAAFVIMWCWWIALDWHPFHLYSVEFLFCGFPRCALLVFGLEAWSCHAILKPWAVMARAVILINLLLSVMEEAVCVAGDVIFTASLHHKHNSWYGGPSPCAYCQFELLLLSIYSGYEAATCSASLNHKTCSMLPPDFERYHAQLSGSVDIQWLIYVVVKRGCALIFWLHLLLRSLLSWQCALEHPFAFPYLSLCALIFGHPSLTILPMCRRQGLRTLCMTMFLDSSCSI